MINTYRYPCPNATFDNTCAFLGDGPLECKPGCKVCGGTAYYTATPQGHAETTHQAMPCPTCDK